MAEGRGGVVKLFFPTDLVSNLQPTRGMKRRRLIYNPKNLEGLPSRASQKPNSCGGLAIERPEKLQP